jgi:hypothetical protein
MDLSHAGEDTMKYASRLTAHATLALALVLGVAACSDAANVLGPENQLEVTNASGSFQIQATALDNVTQTLSYTWENPGTSANVNQSGSLSGTATVTILDHGDNQVYSGNLVETGTFSTETGGTGSWTIQVVLSGVSGALNFRVQSPQ